MSVADPKRDHDGTFAGARPGSCCTLDPSARMTWSAFESLPTAAENSSKGLPLVVPCGHEVIVDQSVSKKLHGLKVLGSLIFKDGVDITMETAFVFICGRFSIGSPKHRHQSKINIVLTGSTEVEWATPSGAIMNFGRAGFITYGGSTYIRGSACETTTWTRLAKSVMPSKGFGTLELEKPVEWKPGDKLIVTSSSTDSGQFEEVTYEGGDGRRIQFIGNLSHCHEGCDLASHTDCVVAAEVASLSRNIVIRGEAGCEPMCGHFMLAHTNEGLVCGVELTNLGQIATEGRYPLHIHLPGESPSLVVKDNALHHNHNRGVVMHGVHHMTAESNVCFDTKGHCFMLEDGVEQHNIIKHNLGVATEGQHFGCSAAHDMTFTCPHRSDDCPNAFWIPNPNNLFEDNVGIARCGAYFFEERHVMGVVRREFHAEAMKIGVNGKIRGKVPLLRFRNNTAHSSGSGIGNYPRMNFPNAANSNGYERFTAWRCGTGIAVHNNFAWPISDARLIQNRVAVMAGTPTARIALKSSRITAGKKGTDGYGNEVAAPFIMNKMGKTRNGHLESCFAPTDAETLNWIRCFGGYADVSQARFFSVVYDPNIMLPCDTMGPEPQPIAASPCEPQVKQIEGYMYKPGWIGGFARGDRLERSLQETISRCDQLGSTCGGFTCSEDLRLCTVRAQTWVRPGKSASYVKATTPNPTPAPPPYSAPLWSKKNTKHHCPFFKFEPVSNQQECQAKCDTAPQCVGISYSTAIGFESDCFLCDSTSVTKNKNQFGFYPKPIATTTPVSVAGYQYTAGWIGGFARGDRTKRSLDDSKKLCDDLGSACGGFTCAPDLSTCTVRQQSSARPSKTGDVSYLKAHPTM